MLGNADKLSFYIEACRSRLGIEISGPDINESLSSFAPIAGKRCIRFGLAAIKSVGDVAAADILAERRRNGAFKSFLNFAQRVDLRANNRRVLEALIKVGAFDGLGENRRYLIDNLERLMKSAALAQKDAAVGQSSLFDFDDLFGTGTEQKNIPDEQQSTSSDAGNGEGSSSNADMPLFEKLQHEHELLGFYLSGHPLDELHGLERFFQTFQPDELPLVPNNEEFRLCGAVESVSKRISKKTNRPWLLFTLSAKDQRYELTLFAEPYETYGACVTEGAVLLIEGTVRKKENDFSLNVMRVRDFRKELPSLIKQLHWLVYPNETATDFFKQLRGLIEKREGSMQQKVSFILNDDYALEGELPYGARTTLTLEDISSLRAHPSFAGLEVTPVEMTPFPKKRFERAY